MAETTRQLIAPKTNLTASVRFGAVLSLIMMAVVIFLLKTTMISGAVIAPGQAVVRGKPKVVQSLDGGVVDAIYVKDGDVVKAGDILLSLDPTLLRVNLDIFRNRLAEAVAREGRLEAEYLGLDTIETPKPVPQLGGASLDRHLAGQKEIFDARKDLLQGRRDQLADRIVQLQSQIEGMQGRIDSTKDQLSYSERELESARKLNESGLARESQVLALERSKSGFLGELSGLQAELSGIRNSIGDAEMEVLQAERQFKEDVVTQLREATATREEMVLQIVSIEKQLARIKITAPSDGIIHEMQVTTVGGVVPPEATIMQVVPVSEGVEFEIRVDPKSIDQVYVGQRARVVFPAFDMRTTPEIFGTLAMIPPSTVADPITGQAYFRVGLSVPPEELSKLGAVDLIPGMPVEAFLQASERSILSYLTKPLTDQLRHAFRDD
ncbi:HlyD family type I secretion periplasmic adaptor subunit [Phaeovulum sp.]|uniref:HlyD family type I secretion periplasmic adaptor subunit n=1 Tax=Phaeovulum sp. TaxID=2934796 RepID=UPI0039E60170